jgi:DNA polymerase III epsilon subunit family exonuclease
LRAFSIRIGDKIVRYIVFDVETPNSKNDRMSAIGIAVVEDGIIKEEFYSLVNPEESFNSFNIHLTGITPEMVKDKPTFSQLWEQIEPIMSSGTLVAHNAPFDMRVLAKCLSFYKIPWQKTANYACTCQIGRRVFPELPNHKLNTICDYLNLTLDHHNAASDTHACAEILLHYITSGIPINSHTRHYDMVNMRTF